MRAQIAFEPRSSIRPIPATRLEAQVRDYWDACDALSRPAAARSGHPNAVMTRPDAVALLSELASGHTPQRLRLAAADRLMSIAPAAAAAATPPSRPLQRDY